jgi:zinc/manganese transport system ATP-binding protein
MNIVLNDVSVGYHPRHTLVHHLSGVFSSGQATAIFGPNGVGKSTLLQVLASVHSHDVFIRGNICYEGGTRSDVVYVPQHHSLRRDIPISAINFLALCCEKKHHDEIMFGLEEVSLHHNAHKNLNELSFGQLQRLLFARLLLEDRPCIILDEPFSAVDFQTSEILLNKILAWASQGKTIVAVMHEKLWVKNFFSHTLLIGHQDASWGKTSDILTDEHLAQAFFF